MKGFITLCLLFISINFFGQELLVWVNMDDGKIIPNNTIQKNLNGSYITDVKEIPFYTGYYLAALQKPYKYCIINSKFEVVSKLYDGLKIPPTSDMTQKPLCLIYSLNNKGYGLLDLSDLNISGKITEKTEPLYGTLNCFTPSNCFRGSIEGVDKDGYLRTLGWHVLSDSGNLVFKYSEAPKSGHPEPISDGFIGKPGYMPPTIIYNSNGVITRDYTNVVTPRNPCSGVIIDKDYCIVNEVKVNGFHTKSPLKHHIYDKDYKLIFNTGSEILWFFPSNQVVLTQSGFLNLKGEKQIDKNKNLNFSDYFRSDWTEKFYEVHGLIQLQKTTQLNDKFLKTFIVLDRLGNILLKDVSDVVILKNGLIAFTDINGQNSLYNPKNKETLTLPKNYALSLYAKGSNEIFSPGYSYRDEKFIKNEFYPEFIYSDPKSNSKYYYDEVGSSSLVVDGNIGFPIEGKKGLRYLLEFAPQGSSFKGRVGNKILVSVPKNLLSTDGYSFVNKSNNPAEENCEFARSEYLVKNPDVKKAGLDPWSHYQNYGKKEGRKWPACQNNLAKNDGLNKKENSEIGALMALYMLKFMLENSQNNSEMKNQHEQDRTSNHSEEKLSENFIYICDDCGKMKTNYTTPFDDTTCPEIRWGGRGYCSECIGDDGKHQYSEVGRCGNQRYVCNSCHTSIMISSEGIRHNGVCGASGSNCCSHNWIKD